jgi:hypothetical protein
MIENKRKLLIMIFLAVFVIGVSVTCVSAADSSSDNSVKPKKISQSDILAASKKIKDYTEKNKCLPDYVTINKLNYSMEEYMYLSSVTLKYRYSNNKNAITVKYNIKSPNNPKGSKISGTLSKRQFTDYGIKAYKYMAKNNVAPNYVSTKLGKMQFQTFVYANSRILTWAANNGAKLPNRLTISIAANNPMNKYMPKYNSGSSSSSSNGTNSSPNPSNSVSMTSIFEASNRLKTYIESNNAIPNTVTVGSNTYSTNDFLYLLSKAIVNRNAGTTSAVTVLSSSPATSPSVNNKLGKIYKAEFVSIAQYLLNFYSTNKRAPNFVNSSLGNLQYQSTIYVFSRIGAYIHNNKNTIPAYVEVTVNSSSKINGGTGNVGPVGNEFIIINGSNYTCGPTFIKYNNKYLISTAKCSCGDAGHYNYQNATFKNYCPFCKIDGTMIYEENTDCPEGMWVCTKCDADFCLVIGREHIANSTKYLTPTQYIEGQYTTYIAQLDINSSDSTIIENESVTDTNNNNLMNNSTNSDLNSQNDSSINKTSINKTSYDDENKESSNNTGDTNNRSSNNIIVNILNSKEEDIIPLNEFNYFLTDNYLI